jgi:ElaB/YqjD/DUF883 family membrane-anchored ribosome-binding protein
MSAERKKQSTEQWVKRSTKSDPIGGYTETHPSYGIIGISRVSSTRSRLFGSEVDHMHYLDLHIAEARRVVNTPNEFIMSDRELIRVSMTEAQFAQMITSPNIGDGVACTIERFTGDKDEPWLTEFGTRPDPPSPEHYTQKFKAAMGERADLIKESLDTARTYVNELLDGVTKPSKTNLKELQSRLECALRQVEANLPYVMNEMEESIEKRMATAINEFESYVAFSLQRKGLEGLASQAPRLTETHQLKELPESSDG